MTGNKSDNFGNSKLMSMGFENQGFTLKKEGQAIKVNMFGVTLGTYNKFDELYKFIMRTKNTMTEVKNQLASQFNDEAYVKNLKAAIEYSKNLVQAKSERDFSDRGSFTGNKDFDKMYKDHTLRKMG